MGEVTRIHNVSADTKSKISRKSAQTLPNHPSEMGYSAEEIKRRFYQPILDATNSALAEIDRVVDEMNTAIGQLDGNLEDYIESNTITEAYRLGLDNTTWQYNATTGLYEVTITPAQHKIVNQKEIGVSMFLLDSNNKYIPVNNYEIAPNGNVRCFHESSGAGYVSVYVKREGFIIGQSATDVEHIIGLAKVAKTNSYNDLDDTPDLAQISVNSNHINRIIAGVQKVGKASSAENADNATYANTSGSTAHSATSDNAKRAVADENGTNIYNNYCRQTGTYQGVTVGKSTLAEKAKADEDGLNIKNNYSKQNGSYPSMTVGNAGRATSAGSADSATKATKDGNGATISSTYAKIAGNGDAGYPNMKVGYANRAGEAGSASTAVSAESATKATQDGLGRDISQTYAIGASIEIGAINIEMLFANNNNPRLTDVLDFFENSVTSFSVEIISATRPGTADKQIVQGSITKVMHKNTYDPYYLFVKYPSGYLPPKRILFVDEHYGTAMILGTICNVAVIDNDAEHVKSTTHIRYRFFNKLYDFANTSTVSVIFMY